jgi:hypothetical protein
MPTYLEVRKQEVEVRSKVLKRYSVVAAKLASTGRVVLWVTFYFRQPTKPLKDAEERKHDI